MYVFVFLFILVIYFLFVFVICLFFGDLLSHQWKQTIAVKSISGEAIHAGTVVATWNVRTGGVLTAVPVVHSTLVYV